MFAWALSGPLTAAILSSFCVLFAFYLGLSTKEPGMFLQILFYGGLFIFMAFYLNSVQRKTNDKELLQERIAETIHLTREEQLKKEALKKALEEKINRLLDLQRFAGQLKGVPGIKEVTEKIVKEARRVLGKAEQCALFLVDESEQALRLVASAGGRVVEKKEGSVFDRWVMKKSQGLLVEDAENDFRFPYERKSQNAHLRSLCAGALVTEKRVLGVVRVASDRPAAFTADDLRVLDIFSDLGAVHLRNILLYQKMQELAIRDSLTGLYLNRYFQKNLAEEIESAAYTQAVFSIIMLDIDFFKRCNDEYGHVVGDIVLRTLASILLKNIGSTDLAARYGGEEFVVLLPGKKKAEALLVAEKIRKEIEENKFSLRHIERRLTASFGVTSFPRDGRTKEELLWAADRHLYRAKDSGRNRVCGNI